MRRLSGFSALAAFVAIVVGVSAMYAWTTIRIYVPEGHSLMLQYKGPLLLGKRVPAKPGTMAEEGEIGVRRNMKGPGRHWYWSVWWERTVVPDLVVELGEVAVVTSKMGANLPGDEYLVDGDMGATANKGILRKVLGPGRHRVHPYAYKFRVIKTQQETHGNQVKHSGWVEIPTGYVGVVTYLADNPQAGKLAGIQENVLPPGLYPVNPGEQQIDIVEIGFRETSITTEKRQLGGDQVAKDDSGEPIAIPNTGITFPSNDAFEIQLDFTAIWGVMPDQAAQMVATFGTVDAIDQKVIRPQSESICRNNGSSLGAEELLIGESRQKFQDDTSLSIKTELEGKNVTLLYGLVRHIYIPQEVRIHIQNRYVADELTITREEERNTAKTEALYKEAEKTVELESERVKVETIKLVAEAMAEGEKLAKEIDAATKKMLATIDRQVAELEAKKTVMLGEATAKADQLQQEAKANKFQLAVEAFGSGDAYNKWQFATGLPDEIDLQLLYAGDGTLWTDLKTVVPTLPVRTPGGRK